MTEPAADLLSALGRTLRTWDRSFEGDQIMLTRPARNPYTPTRRSWSWQELLDRQRVAWEGLGVPAGQVLPLRGLGEAEFTFSAVQALDPYLKHRRPFTYSRGFLPQAVVRFTGQRNSRGDLREGFLTSFVNVSVVQPVNSVDDHVALIDAWLSVLSRLGFHAQHLTISGSIAVWTRREVSGITLHVKHGELPLGDAVLLWNARDPITMATDIGSGLERIAWALTRRPWASVVHGDHANLSTSTALDALRTATLIAGTGTTPASRGPGAAIRRLLRRHRTQGSLGLSRVVRQAHAYWSLVHPMTVPWPDVCCILEDEVFGMQHGRPLPACGRAKALGFGPRRPPNR